MFDSGVEVGLAVDFFVFFSLGTASESVLDMARWHLPSQESVMIREGGGEDSLKESIGVWLSLLIVLGSY